MDPFQSILVHWFLTCRRSCLLSLVWWLPVYLLDSWTWHSRYLCNIVLWTLLPSPVTSTTGYCFCFGSVSSFFLELFLPSSPVAYWAPTHLGSLSFSVLSFCLFILFMVFSRQEYWSGLPFPSPVDHILSELSTMTHLSWVALHGMAHSFIELDKTMVHVVRLVSFLPSDGEG